MEKSGDPKTPLKTVHGRKVVNSRAQMKHIREETKVFNARAVNLSILEEQQVKEKGPFLNKVTG